MSIRSPNAWISFFIKGIVYAHREWPHVPRVGDSVLLMVNPHAPENLGIQFAERNYEGKIRFIVTEVMYGVDSPMGTMQAVHIQLEFAEDIEVKMPKAETATQPGNTAPT